MSGRTAPPVTYYGILRSDQKDVVQTLESEVYRFWDGLESSPAKQRQKAPVDLTVGGLKMLSCSASGPGWPEFIMAKFVEGSPQYSELAEMKQMFEKEYPPVGSTPASSNGSGPARAAGRPDFAIEGGRHPLDPERPVDLLAEAPPSVADRLGMG